MLSSDKGELFMRRYPGVFILAVCSAFGQPTPAKLVTLDVSAVGARGHAIPEANFPYLNGVPSAIPQDFVVANSLFYFDRSVTSSPKFSVQGGCLYAGGAAFTQFQEWSSNPLLANRQRFRQRRQSVRRAA
jgi:hypothetical protein